jgi:RNA polymerase sigma-70 factor (ECF subfamily)
VDRLVLEKLHNENLKEMIFCLPEIQRRRVVLYYYGGFTCKQIAEQENCSVIAVKKTLEAARKNLKKLLE